MFRINKEERNSPPLSGSEAQAPEDLQIVSRKTDQNNIEFGRGSGTQ
jgi:hypothetical protein